MPSASTFAEACNACPKNFFPDEGLAIFRAQPKRRASREQSQACLVSAEAQPTLSKKLKKNFGATLYSLAVERLPLTL